MKKRIAGMLLFFLLVPMGAALAADTLTLWFPPGWKTKAIQAKAITDALSAESGLAIRPRIAKSYPEILEAFSTDDPNLVYVGSFVQAIIEARDLGNPLVQNVNGKEFYSGIMIYPQDQDPQAILNNSPSKVAFAVGASSGESSAKAATSGQASIGVPNHGAAVNAVKAGKAAAAVVKNWWWQANQDKFPGMASYEVPGVSEQKNPDNVLTASKAVSNEMASQVKQAAIARSEAFGSGSNMVPFDSENLDFSLALMKQGNIDPHSYSW